jgi:hypothetical protein
MFYYYHSKLHLNTLIKSSEEHVFRFRHANCVQIWKCRNSLEAKYPGIGCIDEFSFYVQFVQRFQSFPFG